MSGETRPDLFFVESSWKGNSGTFEYRVAGYSFSLGDEIRAALEICAKLKIPTVFWNKEDPVHFNNFIELAKKFDLVLTTALEARELYLGAGCSNVSTMQFYADPSLHRPNQIQEKIEKIIFAGSYYANRFEARQKQVAEIFEVAADFLLKSLIGIMGLQILISFSQKN